MNRRRGTRRSPRAGSLGCGFLQAEEIEALLEGRLAQDRKAAFERHDQEGCASCGLLAADVEVLREVVEGGLLQNEKREFAAVSRATLRRIHEETKGGRLPARPARWSRPTLNWSLAVAVATAVCVAVLATLTLQQSARPVEVRLPGGELMVVEAMVFSAPPALRGTEAPADLWRRAGQAYEASEFKRAARYLRAIEDKQPGLADTSLYLGISLLMTGSPGEARPMLARARERAATLELPQAAAAWYEALSALAENDQAAARQSLAVAAAEGGLFGDRARLLLEKLPAEASSSSAP